MIEGDVVDCMIALPGQLFYSTQIPACLWFLARNKKNGPRSASSGQGFRDRTGEVLFIDARKLGYMVDRTRREFSDTDIETISGAYHRWREGKDYEDVPGFCKSVTHDVIESHGFVLTPGRYVGTEAVEEDSIPFAGRFAELQAKLEMQLTEGVELGQAIRKNLARIGI